MRYFNEVASILELLVLKQIMSILHYVGRDAMRLQPAFDFMGVQGACPIVDQTVQLATMCLAGRPINKSRVGR